MATEVPEDVVKAGMKKFEDMYNEDDTKFCGSCYAKECLVTVNGGTEKGGPFTGKTPEEVAGFLNSLRNEMGGTNIRFKVTKVEGMVHEDTWTADNGKGSCKATWAQIDGEWKIVSDEISFTPKPEEAKAEPAPEGSVEMKVTTKKPASFYIRAAQSFLKGVEAKPAEEGKDGKEGREATEAKAAIDHLRISGLGDAINVAVTAATQAEHDGCCTITKIQTMFPPMEGSGRSCAQIVIDLKRK